MSDIDTLKELYSIGALPRKEMETLNELEKMGALQEGLNALGENDEFINRLISSGGDFEAKPIMSEITSGFGRGTRAVAQGIAGMAGIIYDPISLAVTETINAITDQDKKPVVAREFISKLLTDYGVPEAETKTDRILQAAIEMASGGALQAGIAGVASKAAGAIPTVTKAVTEQLAAQPVQQVAGAAGAGAAQQLAQEEGVGPLGQFIASIVGGVAGGRASGFVEKTPRKLPLASMTEAKKRDIPVMRSDIDEPWDFFGKWFRSTGEKIPFVGTGGKRVNQYKKRVAAIEDTLRIYDVDDKGADLSEIITKNLTSEHKKFVDKYAGMKSGVLSGLENKGNIPLKNTLNQIDREISHLNKIDPVLNKALIDKLNQYKNAFGTEKTAYYADQLRAGLGGELKDQGLANVKDRADKAYNSIYSAFKNDMGQFIKKEGKTEDFKMWELANNKLHTNIKELKRSALKRALNEGDVSPDLVENILFSKRVSEIGKLYSRLSEPGRTTARMAILKKALNKAKDEGKEIDTISVEKFVSEIDRLGKSVKIFFRKNDLKEIEGLISALKLTRQSAISGLNPPTGIQAVPIVGAAWLQQVLGFESMAAGTILGSVLAGGLARAIESKAAKELIIRLPKLKRGSSEEAETVKRLIAVMQSNYNKYVDRMSKKDEVK